MKDYKLNEIECRYILTIIMNIKKKYFIKEFKRNAIVKFESIDSIRETEIYSDIEIIEDRFILDELLRIAKPYLTKKELNILKRAIENADNFKEFRKDLKKNKSYEYKILSKVLKKIGGLISE